MRLIAGVDEVGRGSLIGPVYAAAVIWGDASENELIKNCFLEYFFDKYEIKNNTKVTI